MPVEVGGLRQIGHFDIAAERYLAAVGQLLARQYVEQRTFAVAVAGYQGGLLPCIDAETDVFKQQLVTKRLGKVFYG